MGKKLHETRERLLQQGLALMSRDGMAGVTLGQLAEQVGMSKSGVFAHFRSKDDVQIGLLEQMARVAAPVVVEPAMAAPEGLPRLEALVRNWFGWATRAGLGLPECSARPLTRAQDARDLSPRKSGERLRKHDAVSPLPALARGEVEICA